MAGKKFDASMIRCAVYTRKSTSEGLEQEFNTLDAQREAAEAFIASQRGQVDCIVVYKVDRLSRSLLDFTRMMETLEQRSVSFVSVTQQFNTTSSMGRLTLNILLSFAQFEREIISERTRDKIAAARRKGKWSGGRQRWTPNLGQYAKVAPGLISKGLEP